MNTHTSSTVNEITAISETVGSSLVDPAYDAAGNMITGPLGTTPTTKLHFVFDAWNRMVTVKADSSGSPGSTIASYTYDGRNRRITKTIGGSTYHGYYNNNWQYLETRIDSSTSSSGQLVWDLRYIDSPLALLGGTYPLYYTNDANFNVTALIDGHTGAVSERSQYDPYGKVQFYTDAWLKISTSAANNPILYCGYTLDSESGLYLARNRYLNMGLGVWEKRDPVGYASGNCLYQYVGSRPMYATDPAGLAATAAQLAASALITAEENLHKPKAYFVPTGLNNFFAYEQSTILKADVQYEALPAGILAQWHDVRNVMGLTKTASPSTVIHETVHAIDDFNDWHIRTFVDWRAAEALAYGTEALLAAVRAKHSLSDFETTKFKDCAAAQLHWQLAWTQINGVIGSPYTYGVWGGTANANIAANDIWDIRAKLKIVFSCSALKPIYESLLLKAGAMEQLPAGVLGPLCGCRLSCTFTNFTLSPPFR